MADKSISELVAATAVNAADLFVLEQGGAAKKLTGQTLENWLVSFADGHGGIQSIEYTAPVSPSLVGSMLVTMADTTTADIPVYNGRSITDITWTTSGTAGNGRTHTGTITYNDGTTSTVTFKDGVKGNTGAASYVWIKYAGQQPTRNADMGNNPDKWMGVYSGTSSTAPANYTDYAWFEIKGNTGDPATVEDSEVRYQVGTTGTVAPSGTWSSDVPIVPQGQWLWTRVTLTFNTGSPVVYYSASRQGIDGEGAAGISVPLPDVADGAVGESVSFAREDHQHPLTTLHITANLTSLPTTISDSGITADMRVVNCAFGTPAAVLSNVSWSTGSGSIALSGTLSGSTTVDLDLDVF